MSGMKADHPRGKSPRTMNVTARRPRLLILGSGFAAFGLLKRVDLRAYDVTVVSRRNHFLYTPLLPSTAVGTVEFRTIIEPIRRSRPGARCLLGEAESLDPTGRSVRCRSPDGEVAWDQPYDVLAIGVGAEGNTFGVPGVREHACPLKELADARVIRERVIATLERASLPGLGEEERQRLLHFVAVGAGPTGVRFAAELHDLLAADLPRSYPELVARVRITLLEAGPAMLSAYDATLREYAARQFRRDGVEVRTGSPVSEVGPAGLRLRSGEEVPAGLVLWSAGFAPTPFVAGLPFARDRAGRLVTDDRLRVLGHEDVFALGDCACPKGRDLPQLAQVAEQQGRYLGDALNRRTAGRASGPFAWRSLGIGSFLGAGRAVVESAGRRRKHAGFWAYQLWRSAVFTRLVSPKNKILVPMDRLRAFVFGRDLSKF
jgi:NADH dehydrogenase FAD-containing subunit